MGEVKYSLGLMADHKTFKTPKMVKVFADGRKLPGQFVLSVESAHNLERINHLGSVTLSQVEFDQLPQENMEYTKAVFAMFDLAV